MDTFLALDEVAPPHMVRIPFPLPAYLTLREAGDMRRDGRDRTNFISAAGIDGERIHACAQVHSRNVAVAPGDTAGIGSGAAGEHVFADADGLVTTDRSIVLTVTVADCMPIFIADRAGPARGLLHSGWKGTGILGNAIRRMREEFGCDPEDLVVTMGPCICAECYEVDADRARMFAEEWGADAVKTRNEKHYLDLRAANEEICHRNGVDLVNVINHCTVQDSRLASYRRQGPEKYTLMMALLCGEDELETGDS